MDINSYTSVQEVQDAAPDANIKPPIELTDGAQGVWKTLVVSKPASDWSPADLLTLADLAECHAELLEEKVKLKDEGHVIVNQGGNEFRNPRSGVVGALRREIMQLTRFLIIAPGHMQNKSTKLAKAIVDANDEDDLLS